MTAEIAIINKSAVALAADSAVTVGRERVWKNANKLFHVSPNTDIGVMIFGNGDFEGIPWEVLIKEFRKTVGLKKFETTKDCVECFCNFLCGFQAPNDQQINLNVLLLIIGAINDCRPDKNLRKTLARRKQLLSKADKLTQDALDLPECDSVLAYKEFTILFGDVVKKFMSEELNMHITKEMHERILKLSYERTRRQFQSEVYTGIVFAGYGEKDLLPAVYELMVDGKCGNLTRIWSARENNLNENHSTSAMIMPFAQADIAYLFMEGLLPDHNKYMELTLHKILDKKSDQLIKSYVDSANRTVELAKEKKDNRVLVEEFQKEFHNFRRERVVNPMMNVVQHLPKEEMAAMAEALVEITSLRRKMDSRLETVGGPVDLAIISKADGFVWIKRKHYFDIELNRDFISRKQARFYKEGFENDQ